MKAVISYSSAKNKPLIMTKRIKNKWRFHTLISILYLSIILAGSCKKIDLEKLHENITHVRTLEEAQELLKETIDSLDNIYPYLIITTALYSDEAVYNGSNSIWKQFQSHDIKSDNAINSRIWFTGYKIIDNAAILMRDVENFEEESIEQDNIVGQAKTIWAFTHLLLTNLYGDIPMLWEPLKQGDNPGMYDKETLYEGIIEYLGYAIDYLYESDISDNTVINKNAAKALLARAYLYNKQWTEASQAADEIITSGDYSLCENYQEAFIKNKNPEVIWKLDYNSGNKNMLGYYGYPADSGGIFEYAPYEGQTNAYELTDLRKLFAITWANSTGFISKYRNPSTGDFDIPVIRYSEILLIAAEAALKSGNSATSLEYINEVRERAKRNPYEGVSLEDIEPIILKERQCELAYECHRWFDINRKGMAGDIIGSIDDDFTTGKHELWPMPQKALDENPNLIQNPGY
jgi:hypothetical protein